MNMSMNEKNKKPMWLWVLAVVVIVMIVLLVVGSGKKDVKAPHELETVGDPVVSLSALGEGAVAVSSVLGNANILVPETSVRTVLSDGAADFVSGETRGAVILGEVFAAQRASDGKYDLFAIAGVNYGGSGTFQYLLSFRADENGVEHTGSALLGDRVAVMGIEVPGEGKSDYTVSVHGFVRDPYEPPYVEPTIEWTWDFFMAGHRLIVG